MRTEQRLPIEVVSDFLLQIDCVQTELTHYPKFTILFFLYFSQVDVTNRSSTVDLSNYVYSGEWELIDILVVRNQVTYACCIEFFPDVTFTIIMRRRTLYYLFNIIFPCLWLTVLSLLGFWLPPDSGEKITLGITVLLAFSVFMLLIAENMPATSEFVPLIGMFSWYQMF